MVAQTALLRPASHLGRITGPPYITLVDIDGSPVPDHERTSGYISPDPIPADSWPAWTDLVTVGLGTRQPFEHRIGGVKFGDAYRRVLERADAAADEPADDEEAVFGPIGELPDLMGPHDRPFDDTAALVATWEPAGPDAPDADPAIASPGIASLALRRAGIAPVAGGSPEYEPTAEDMADYCQWSAELDARRDAEDFYRRHPLAEFNAIRPD
jgi:hypothetical protein